MSFPWNFQIKIWSFSCLSDHVVDLVDCNDLNYCHCHNSSFEFYSEKVSDDGEEFSVWVQFSQKLFHELHNLVQIWTSRSEAFHGSLSCHSCCFHLWCDPLINSNCLNSYKQKWDGDKHGRKSSWNDWTEIRQNFKLRWKTAKRNVFRRSCSVVCNIV